MRQYEMCEIEVKSGTPGENWAESSPQCVFTHGDTAVKLRGFVAGEGTYKFRFLPDAPGTWNYTVTGDVTASGSVEVAPAAGSHGLVKAVDCHFEYQDGTLFTPFGTTVYALIHQEPEIVEQTMRTLETAPFNKIRFCVFPKHYDFNHNEPPRYAFRKAPDGSWNVREPDFDFWAALEDAITRLGAMGVQCDLILFHPYDCWGFSEFSEEEDGIYLDYLIRRLAAFPNVWWSLANEYDLFAKKDFARWEFIEEYIAARDPYGHLLGNHNCFRFWDAKRPNVTHLSAQTKMFSRVAEWRREYKKPVCVDECCYEGNIINTWGAISGREMTYRFWRVVVTGGYCTHGETFYDENEVLWWAKGGVLHGESPARIAFLKGIVDSLPGPIEPIPGFIERCYAMSPEERERAIAEHPKPVFLRSMLSMDPNEAKLFQAAEPTYAGHVGEEAFIQFFDLRTSVKGDMALPEGRKYTLELIDVWNMTRQVISRGASGKTVFDLPGKEGFAVLALAEKE